MDVSINERLIKYCKTKGVKQKDLVSKIHISKDQISKWFGMVNQISVTGLVAFIKNFEEVNARWLMTGEGNMIDHNSGNKICDFGTIQPFEKTPPEVISSMITKIEDLRIYVNKLETDKEYLRKVLDRNRRRKELCVDMLYNELKNSGIEKKDSIYKEMIKIIESDKFDFDLELSDKNE